MMNSTLRYRLLLRTFESVRRYVPYPKKHRDELSWRQLRFLRGRQATVNNQLGQSLSVRLDSLGDLQAAFGRREEAGIAEVLSKLPPGGVVLDIGAHIGGFSLIAAKAVGPSGHVFAFEPVSANTRLLEQNARLNNIGWITPIQAAVGRTVGSIELLVSDADTMWATTRQSWANELHGDTAPAHLRSEEVPLTTVDDFVREHSLHRITLMKIDVEAAELEVLAGAAGTLASGNVEQLLIEVHGPTVKWKHVAAIMRGYGYDVTEIGRAEMHAVLRRPAARAAEGSRTINKPLTVALVGCGAVSERHYSKALDTLASEGLVETVALVDPDSEGRVKLSALLTTARHYSDVESMLKETRPDFAIVAAPHKFHAQISITCLRKGVHVLCEKPMALTTSDCDRMIEAAASGGLVLAVGHFRRFYPSCEIIKSILDSGLLGTVKSFDYVEGRPYNWPARTTSLFTRDEAGGGALADTGAHALDLILWWLGAARELVYEDDAMGGIEANCRLRLKMTRGGDGSIFLSRDWPLANRCIIQCEKGWVQYTCDEVDHVRWGLYDSNYGLNAQLRKMAPANEGSPFDMKAGVSDSLDTYFTAQVRNVVAAIHGKEPVRVSGVEARKTIAVIEACYRDRRLLPMPWLDEAEIRRAQEMAHGG